MGDCFKLAFQFNSAWTLFPG